MVHIFIGRKENQLEPWDDLDETSITENIVQVKEGLRQIPYLVDLPEDLTALPWNNLIGGNFKPKDCVNRYITHNVN